MASRTETQVITYHHDQKQILSVPKKNFLGTGNTLGGETIPLSEVSSKRAILFQKKFKSEDKTNNAEPLQSNLQEDDDRAIAWQLQAEEYNRAEGLQLSVSVEEEGGESTIHNKALILDALRKEEEMYKKLVQTKNLQTEENKKTTEQPQDSLNIKEEEESDKDLRLRLRLLKGGVVGEDEQPNDNELYTSEQAEEERNVQGIDDREYSISYLEEWLLNNTEKFILSDNQKAALNNDLRILPEYEEELRGNMYSWEEELLNEIDNIYQEELDNKLLQLETIPQADMEKEKLEWASRLLDIKLVAKYLGVEFNSQTLNNVANSIYNSAIQKMVNTQEKDQGYTETTIFAAQPSIPIEAY